MREFVLEEILEFLPYIDFNCFSLSGIITMCTYLENQQKIMEKVTWDKLLHTMYKLLYFIIVLLRSNILSNENSFCL